MLVGIYLGPPGQGRDFAPGFDLNNYLIVDAGFATQNVFFDPGLKSPLTKEFTVSAGGALGNRGHLKATYIRRWAGNFIEDFLDLSTGATEVMHEGRSYGMFNNQLFRNTDELDRNYDALQFDGRYSVTNRFQLDGSYTVRLRNEGNFEGEGTNLTGDPSVAFDYPEIFTPERNYPFGRLNDFQRHQDLHLENQQPRSRLGRRRRPGRHLPRTTRGRSSVWLASGVPLSDFQDAILEELEYASGPTSENRYFDARCTENVKGYGLLDLSVQLLLSGLAHGGAVLQARAAQRVQQRLADRAGTATVDAIYDGPVHAVQACGPPTRPGRGAAKGPRRATIGRGRPAWTAAGRSSMSLWFRFEPSALELAAAAAAGFSFRSDSGSTGIRSRKPAHQRRRPGWPSRR